MFVGRTGTGDARTHDLALAANSEPPHQSKHVAFVPGRCWEQEPGDQPPVAWSQWQGHWGQQRQVCTLQTDKPSEMKCRGVEPRRAWWEACVHNPIYVMALALLMSCLELRNVELLEHHMALVYPIIYVQNSRRCLLVVRNTMAWFSGEAGDSSRHRPDLPWSQPVRWPFLYLLSWNIVMYQMKRAFGFWFSGTVQRQVFTQSTCQVVWPSSSPCYKKGMQETTLALQIMPTQNRCPSRCLSEHLVSPIRQNQTLGWRLLFQK